VAAADQEVALHQREMAAEALLLAQALQNKISGFHACGQVSATHRAHSK